MNTLCMTERPAFAKAWLGLTLAALWILATAATSIAPAQGTGPAELRTTGRAFSAVASKVSPALVFIKVEKHLTGQAVPAAPLNDPSDLFNDEFFRRFFGDRFPGRRPSTPRNNYRITGQGSGFIISTDGYILTNNHVVGDADVISVKLNDGRELKAKLIGTDPHTDVALIKIPADGLPVLPMGNSDDLEVGEWVLAFGNPFGLSDTVTAGVVSAKGRSNVGIADYEDFIQTDAAINPGNSGGPLVNLEGKAVGINTAIFSRSGGYMGIGFAIPINMARRVEDQLLKHGSVTRGFLGIIIQDVTPQLSQAFNLGKRTGILVADVNAGSPAQAAGIRRGDVILKLDGTPVKEIGPFRNRIALLSPGTAVNLTVLRDGREQSVTVKIGKLPSNAAVAAGVPEAASKLGITVKNLTSDVAERLGYTGESGVLIEGVEPGSLAALAGLRPGVLIQEVNRKRVRNVDDFRKAIEHAAGTGTILLLVRDGRFSRYVALQLEGQGP